MGKQGVILENHRDIALVGALVVHHFTQQPDFAAVAVRLFETRQQPKRGGLSAAAGAQDREELAFSDVKGDIVHGLDIAEALGHPGEPDHRLGGGALWCGHK